MRKFLTCSVVGVAVFGGALAACGGGGGGGGSQQAFCDTLKKDVAVFSDLDNQSDLGDTQVLQEASKALDDLAKKAPSEIKADMDKVAKGVKDSIGVFDQLSDAIKEGDTSKLSDLDKQFSDQNKGFEQATQNVEKFAKDKCGIDLNSGSSSSSSRSSSRSTDPFSDLSDLTSDFTDFSSFSDFSDFTDLSSLDSVFSDLDSLFSS
jgi:hypothetical protein